MSMTSRQVTMWQGHCDYPGCDAIVTDDEWGSTDFWEAKEMVEIADNDGWMTCADDVDKHLYCPEHWHLDDDDNQVSNDGKVCGE